MSNEFLIALGSDPNGKLALLNLLQNMLVDGALHPDLLPA